MNCLEQQLWLWVNCLVSRLLLVGIRVPTSGGPSLKTQHQRERWPKERISSCSWNTWRQIQASRLISTSLTIYTSHRSTVTYTRRLHCGPSLIQFRDCRGTCTGWMVEVSSVCGCSRTLHCWIRGWSGPFATWYPFALYLSWEDHLIKHFCWLDSLSPHFASLMGVLTHFSKKSTISRGDHGGNYTEFVKELLEDTPLTDFKESVRSKTLNIDLQGTDWLFRDFLLQKNHK